MGMIFNLSYFLSLYFIYLLTKIFFKWFRVSNNRLFLSFFVSTAILFCNSLLGIILIDIGIPSMPITVYPHYLMGYVPYFFDYMLLESINNLIAVTTIGCFCMFWISTVLLLYSYSFKLGKITFWCLTLIPLVFFLIPFIPNIIYFIPNHLLNYYFTFVSFNKTIGGILFGLSFFILARGFDKDTALKKYLNIFGIGLTLIFITNQSLIMLNLSYPPFGLVGISMISFGSLLLFYGISYISAHLNYNVQMRKQIEKITHEELSSYSFLNEIAKAEVVSNLEKRVNQISNRYLKEMDRSYNIQNSYLKDDTLSEYLQQVICELGLDKNGINN